MYPVSSGTGCLNLYIYFKCCSINYSSHLLVRSVCLSSYLFVIPTTKYILFAFCSFSFVSAITFLVFSMSFLYFSIFLFKFFNFFLIFYSFFLICCTFTVKFCIVFSISINLSCFCWLSTDYFFTFFKKGFCNIFLVSLPLCSCPLSIHCFHLFFF